MRIRIKEDSVRLRTSPEFLDDNIVTLLPSGTIFTSAERQGDWWKVPNGFIHASMAQEIKVQASQITTNLADPRSVPYRSQWDADASNRTGDCGQTCVAMLAEWQGVHVNINDLRFQQTESGLTTAADLINNFKDINLAAQLVRQPVGQLPPLPAICLIWYGGLERDNVQDKNYKGLHWLVLLDQNAAGVITHDPDYWDRRRSEGEQKQYSWAEWHSAFVPYTENATTIAVILQH